MAASDTVCDLQEPVHSAYSIVMIAHSTMPMKGTRGAALSVLITELKRTAPHVTVRDLQDVAKQNCMDITDDLLLRLAQACMGISTILQHNVRSRSDCAILHGERNSLRR